MGRHNDETESATASKSEKMKNKDYEKDLRKLHVELVRLQEWVKHKGLKVCVVFEGATAPEREARLRRSRNGSALACFASSPCPRPPIAKRPRCTSSGTFLIYRLPAK